MNAHCLGQAVFAALCTVAALAAFVLSMAWIIERWPKVGVGIFITIIVAILTFSYYLDICK